MSKIIIASIAGIVLLLGFWIMGSYNGLVTSKETVTNQWAQVETQYQRRFDLIPNLVESVKGAMQQEQEIFTALADARTRYAGAQTTDERAEAATQVESAFARLLVVMENYPELRSIETVQTLMTQIEGTENRISVERKRFNDAVQTYNLRTKRFPGMILANMFGFEEHSYFESADGSEQAPQIRF